MSKAKSKELRDLVDAAYRSIDDLAHVGTSRETGAEIFRAVEYFDKCIKTILDLAIRTELEETSFPIGVTSGPVDTIYQFAEPVYRLQTVIMADGVDQLPHGTRLYTHPQRKYASAADAIRQYRIMPKGSTWRDVKDDEVWDAMTKHPESYETRVLYKMRTENRDAF